MRRTSYTIFALILFIGCAGNIPSENYQGPKAELPKYEVGEKWVFKDLSKKIEVTTEIIEVIGDNIKVLTEGDPDYCRITERNRSFTLISKTKNQTGHRDCYPGWKYLDFPLWVGKQWFFSADGQSYLSNTVSNYLNWIDVMSYEDLKIGSNIFKTFKLRHTQTSLDANKKWTRYFWYAPEAKKIVKWDNGDSDGSDIELKSYTINYENKPQVPASNENVDDSTFAHKENPPDKKISNKNPTIPENEQIINKGNSIPTMNELIKEVYPGIKTWAVVIGIDEYSQKKNGFEPLPYAVLDAKAIKNTLIEYMGLEENHIFSVYNEDATKQKIEELLGDILTKRISKKDRLIVYFSGHGETDGDKGNRDIKQGYLIPIDGKKDALYSTSLSMKHIRDFCDLIPARQIVFIIDSCYSGIAGVTHKGGNKEKLKKINFKDIQQYMNDRGRQIMTAGKSGEKAIMGAEWENHSIYSYYLLKGLQGNADYNHDGIITQTELQMFLEINVSRDTHGTQNPQYFQSVGEGQFVFYNERD